MDICYLLSCTHPNPSLLRKEGLKASHPLLLLARESRLRDRRSQRGRGDEFMEYKRNNLVIYYSFLLVI